VEQDADSTHAIYGGDPSFRAILSGNIRAPRSTLGFVRAVVETGRAGTVAEAAPDQQ
jgi:hypothetical protein